MDGQKSDDNPTPAQFAPGDTVRPQQQEQAQPSQPAQAPQQAEIPAPSPISEAPASDTTAPATPSQDLAPSVAPQGSDARPEYRDAQPDEVISWTASEFIAHHKTSGWYALLLLAAVVAAFLVWFVTKDLVSGLVVVFAGVILATYASRKPRQLNYQIDPSGLTIEQKHYSFSDFRSFSVMQDGAFASIVFAPLKRFGTLLTIYYDPQDEERIINALSGRLPHEERRPDPIDSMMRRIRF